jgi:hypothetical protein
MNPVKWPGNAYDPKAEDLSAPMQQLLKDLNLLEGEGTVSPVRGTPQSLQVITAGGTALSKGWAAFVGLFGGGGALWAALQGFGADPQDEALQRAVFVASAAVLLAAAVIAIAIIVRADVVGRAEASAAEYAARASVANALLNSFQYGRPLPIPLREPRNWLRKKDARGRVDPKWLGVVGFEWDERAKELTAVVDSGTKVPMSNVEEWVTGTAMEPGSAASP